MKYLNTAAWPRSIGCVVERSESSSSMSSESDEALMEKYQGGDEAAFEEIYGRYARKIYGFLMHRLRQPALCAELYQETFLRLHRGRHLYQSDKSFKTWLYTIANNLIRDSYRAKSRGKTSSMSEHEENSVERATPEGGDHVISFKEAFAALTEDQREAVILSRFEGLKYEEIAQVMGRSTAAVNQLIQRALHRLRDSIYGS